MKRSMRFVLAAVLAVTVVGGALPSADFAGTPLFDRAVKASAEEKSDELLWEEDEDELVTVAFDEATGTLTLKAGAVDDDEIFGFRYDNRVRSVTAEDGAVLPADCSALSTHFESAETIDLSRADWSQVKYMAEMFLGCSAAKSIEFGDLSGGALENLGSLFENCSSLEYIDLTGFNTFNVNCMANMFLNCGSLTSLDLTSFDPHNVRDISRMFQNCAGLKTIKVSNKWGVSSSSASELMFSGCNSLVGGDGTQYINGWTPEDASCAKIDMESDHGYLTADRPIIYGASLSLTDCIGVTYHVQLRDHVAKVVLSGPSGTKTITDFSPYQVRRENPDTYKFTYGVNASKGAQKTSMRLYDAQGNLLETYKSDLTADTDGTVELSVYDYIDRYVSTGDSYTDDLVMALRDYCRAADNYFNGASYTFENVPQVDLSTLQPDLMNIELENEEETPKSIRLSLVLNSKTAIRIYTDAKDVKIWKDGDCDPVSLPAYKNANGQYYEIPGIRAASLWVHNSLMIDGQTYDVWVNSYILRAMRNKKVSTKLRDVCNTLYAYENAAKEYYLAKY